MKATSSLFDPSVFLQIWLSKHFGRENFKPHRMRCRFHRFGDIHYLIRTMQVNGNESIESTENVCQVSIKQISMLDCFNSINIGIVTFHVRICVIQEETVKLCRFDLPICTQKRHYLVEILEDRKLFVV